MFPRLRAEETFRETIERLSMTFTANGKRQAPAFHKSVKIISFYLVSFLWEVAWYMELTGQKWANNKQGSSFFGKTLISLRRLPFVVNVILNLSNVSSFAGAFKLPIVDIT